MTASTGRACARGSTPAETEPSPQQWRRAGIIVCARAADPDEATELLSMLGITEALTGGHDDTA